MKVEYLGKEAGYGYRLANIACKDNNEVDIALKILAKTSYKASYIMGESIGIRVEDKYDYDTLMCEWKQAKKNK